MARNPHLDEGIVGRESFDDSREQFIARSNQPYFPSQDYRDTTGAGEFSGWRGQEDIYPYETNWKDYPENEFGIPKIFSAPIKDLREKEQEQPALPLNPYEQSIGDFLSMGERESLYDESLYPYGGASIGDISIGERESPPVYYDRPEEEEFVDEEDSSRRKFLEYLLRNLLSGSAGAVGEIGKGLGQFMGRF